jgi:hypothetical protein
MSKEYTYTEAAELEQYLSGLDEYEQFLEEIDEEDFLGMLEEH